MNFLKELKWNTITLAVLFLILGIVLIWQPGMAARTLCYMLAWILIAVGAVQTLGYFLRGGQAGYRGDLTGGLLLLLFGGFILYKANLVISLTPFLLGFFITGSGISKLQNALELKRMGYSNWLVVLILAVISILAGLVMIRNPFQTAEVLFRLIGISLVYSGATDLYTVLYLGKKLQSYRKEREKDIIDM